MTQPAAFPSLRSINASQVIAGGLFNVSFADVREAMRAHDMAGHIVPYSQVFPLSPKGLAIDQGRDPTQITDFEGQVIVSAYYNGGPAAPRKEAAPIIAEMKRLLTQCGDIKATHTLPPTQNHVREFRVEFFNTDAIDAAKDVVNGTIINVSYIPSKSYCVLLLLIDQGCCSPS